MGPTCHILPLTSPFFPLSLLLLLLLSSLLCCTVQGAREDGEGEAERGRGCRRRRESASGGVDATHRRGGRLGETEAATANCCAGVRKRRRDRETSRRRRAMVEMDGGDGMVARRGRATNGVAPGFYSRG